MTEYMQIEAIILRSRIYKEHDKLLDIFSLSQGRMTVLAKGAAKPNGGLRALAQPFILADLNLAKGKGFDVLTQGLVTTSFISLKQDLAKIAYASYFSELILSALPLGKPAPELFAAVLAAFSLVDIAGNNQLAARYLELQVLKSLGISPYLDDCYNCGRSLNNSRFFLSGPKGGLICASCLGENWLYQNQNLLLSPGAIMTMRRLLSSPLAKLPQIKISRQINQELENGLEQYLSYFLENASKAKAVFKSLEVD